MLLAVPAWAQPGERDVALCQPFVNAALTAEDLRGDWPYTRFTATGDTYRGCLRMDARGAGVNRVEYFAGRERRVVEFDVTAQVQGDRVVFEGRGPARHLVGGGSYAVDHFTCAAVPQGFSCAHEDAAGTVDPDFTLRRLP